MEMQTHRSMYRFFCSILLLAIGFWARAQEGSNDTVAVARPDAKQIRVGIDISRPVLNQVFRNRHSYEFSLDYSLPKDIYLVAEGGFGGSDVAYEDLRYTSNNSFFRAGIDKSMLQRLFPSDWDYLFVGLRYGVGLVERSDAVYTTVNPVWGSTSGSIEGKKVSAHWAELTAGLRVELLKGFFAGYTVRAKFLITQSVFRELPPAYVAGYGKGEKTTSFDFNFYLQYALRW